MKKIKDKPWFPIATAICIGVVLYVVLNNLGNIWSGFKTFLGFFETVIAGATIAYLINPLSKFLYKHLSKIKKEKVRKTVSNIIAYIIVIVFLIVAVLILIPQIIQSIELFVSNVATYTAIVESVVTTLGSIGIDISGFVSSSEQIFNSITNFVTNNSGRIINTITGTGKGLFNFVIAFILSIYFLFEKENIKNRLIELNETLFDENKAKEIEKFGHKCNEIFNRYIVYNIIDAIIVGISNAIFMTIAGFEYCGLISYVVAIANLIPTFGPIAGAIIGGFILLMVNPIHALIFLIFTLILQTIDGYVIKPHLFGGSLGVSGLWILISIIVGGNMFGVVGIFVAVPCIAIIILVYESYFLPWLKQRKLKKNN